MRFRPLICRGVQAGALLFSLILASPARGDTIPGGDVSGTWTVAGSPYLITGEITVPVDQTLSIQPGVEVRFQGFYKLVIRGQLLAVGAEGDTIRFLAENAGTGWHGLRFMDTATTGQPASELRYCRIQDGKATGACPDNRGGGIYLGQATALISHCLIRGNSAVFGISYWGGGGIFCEYSSDVVIQDNIVSDNFSAGDGGGIYVYFCAPEIAGNIIEGNTASARGAGIACFNFASASIHDNIIRGNTGAGLYISGSFAQVVNNVIADHTDSGIHSYLCNPYIIGNLIAGNVAGRGAGILNEGASPQVTNNTIVANTAGVEGGGVGSIHAVVGMLYQSNPSLTNNIVHGNSAPVGAQICAGNDCTTSIRYCDVEALDGSGVVGATSLGVGNMDEPPLFVGADPHPYALSADSPCRDSGLNSAPNLPATDLMGNDRILDGIVDLGAYEFSTAVGVPAQLGPAAAWLGQNYPNPFNPATTIVFTLPSPRQASLDVFTARGERVATIVRQVLSAGRHEVIWNGRNERDQAMPSGIYNYRLRAGDIGVTRQMILLK